jgi:4-amino-4-deoxy-L-arabinose transferase-like glycosyltransferase
MKRIGILVILGLTLLLAYAPWGLWERDEGRYADVAQEMLERGDFITPRANGAVFLDKPPLLFWATAASLALFGRHETAARLPQLLFALITLLATYGIGRRLLGTAAAGLALIVLASSLIFFVLAHVLTLDLSLACCVTVTLFFFLAGYRAGARGGGLYLAMWAAAGFGLLAKGPIALVLAGMTILGFLLLRREPGRVLDLRPWVGPLICLAVAAPWYVAISIATPAFAPFFFLRQNVDRFLTPVYHRLGGWDYYLKVIIAGMLPWTLVIPGALLRLARRRDDGGGSAPTFATALRRLAGAPARSESCAFLLAWMVPGLLFLTVSHSKLPAYALPLIPALALAVAALLQRDMERHPRAAATALLLPALLLAPAAAAVLVVARMRPLAEPAASLLPWIAGTALVASAGHLAGWLLARRGALPGGTATVGAAWMAALWLLMAGVGASPLLNDTRHLAEILRQRRAGEPVYTYRCYLRGLPYYLDGVTTVVASHSDDLTSGEEGPHDPRSFSEEAPFLAALRAPDRVFVIVPRSDLTELQRRAGMPLQLLATTLRHALLSNRPGTADPLTAGPGR